MITLVLLVLTAGPGFRDSATSSVTLTETGTWKITNVTYEHAGLILKGKSTDVLIRQTETMEFSTGTNERPRHFVLEGFTQFKPKEKPVVLFEADGDTVEVWSTMFAVHSSISIHETIELFDVDSKKRFLVASSNFDRVVGTGEDQFVGYEVMNGGGRLVLSTPHGERSEVTFPQKKDEQWAPKVSATRERVRLEFGDKQVVEVPIIGRKLNGKDTSQMPLP